MAIDPKAVGATTDPMLFEWTDRDTILYALGVGAGTEDLSFTTENSHGITQQVLPTYAVICCPAFGAAGSGACSRMDCDPCNNKAQLNFPISAPAANAGQQITA